MRLLASAALLTIDLASIASSQAATPAVQPDPANFTGKLVGHPTSGIFVNSGYTRYGGMPGNVRLAFAP